MLCLQLIIGCRGQNIPGSMVVFIILIVDPQGLHAKKCKDMTEFGCVLNRKSMLSELPTANAQICSNVHNINPRRQVRYRKIVGRYLTYQFPGCRVNLN